MARGHGGPLQPRQLSDGDGYPVEAGIATARLLRLLHRGRSSDDDYISTYSNDDDKEEDPATGLEAEPLDLAVVVLENRSGDNSGQRRQ